MKNSVQYIKSSNEITFVVVHDSSLLRLPVQSSWKNAFNRTVKNVRKCCKELLIPVCLSY